MLLRISTTFLLQKRVHSGFIDLLQASAQISFDTAQFMGGNALEFILTVLKYFNWKKLMYIFDEKNKREKII